jgi:hypothetical protein
VLEGWTGVAADEPGITSEPLVTDEPLPLPAGAPGAVSDPTGIPLAGWLSVMVPVGIVTVPAGATTMEVDGWFSVGCAILGGVTTTVPGLGLGCGDADAGIGVMVGGLIWTDWLGAFIEVELLGGGEI